MPPAVPVNLATRPDEAPTEIVPPLLATRTACGTVDANVGGDVDDPRPIGEICGARDAIGETPARCSVLNDIGPGHATVALICTLSPVASALLEPETVIVWSVGDELSAMEVIANVSAGAAVSITTDSAAEATLVLPAVSVAFAVMLCGPSASAEVVIEKLPPVATPVPSTVVPSLSKIVTVLPASAVPVNVASSSLMVPLSATVAGHRRYVIGPRDRRRRRRRGVDRDLERRRGRTLVARRVGRLRRDAVAALASTEVVIE